jgi:signal transduction histidine kinase
VDELLPYAVALASACGAGARALRLQQRAAEAERSRDEFISFAAHELRNPVTSTKGYAQLLARQARKQPLPEAMMQSVRAVEEQSGRIGDMVGELLDASRIQRGALDVVCQTVDAVPLVTKLVERRVSRGEPIVIELDPEAPTLVGQWDPQRVEQIIRDLLDNAARFNLDGATVRVTLERAGQWAWVTVRDEGIGVQPEDRDHIFDYLYRAPSAQKRNISGLGLGLYVSRFLAERMGGSLELVRTSAAAPSGSVFRLALPLSLR